MFCPFCFLHFIFDFNWTNEVHSTRQTATFLFSLSKKAVQLRSQEDRFPFSNKDIIKFVNNYQINEMYLRYFGWQFIGREYHKENFYKFFFLLKRKEKKSKIYPQILGWPKWLRPKKNLKIFFPPAISKDL